MRLSLAPVLMAIAVSASLSCAPAVAVVERSGAPEASVDEEPPRAESAPASACNEQPPQEFLIRGNYVYKTDVPRAEAQRRKQLHRAAIEYRARRYGFVRGFGDPAWNPHEPAYYSEVTTFFGIRVRMNARVIPALRCVEEEIRLACSASPYAPRLLDGMRFRNTFYDGEVTNHAYGIAIDIDPDRNSCCGCVPPLNSWPRCRQPAATPYERARIPRCWVDSFAKYGFYWLGNDPIEDTMHFEFLGDPDRIARDLTGTGTRRADPR